MLYPFVFTQFQQNRFTLLLELLYFGLLSWPGRYP